jgi:hypothetical protein
MITMLGERHIVESRHLVVRPRGVRGFVVP